MSSETLAGDIICRYRTWPYILCEYALFSFRNKNGLGFRREYALRIMPTKIGRPATRDQTGH